MTPRGEIGGAYGHNKGAIAFSAPPEAQSLFGGSSVIRPQDTWRATFIVREVLFGVAQAYYEVLLFRAQVTIAQDTLNLASEEPRRAKVRFRVGEVTKT